MLKYFDTPLQEISSKILKGKGVQLFVKREDLNHPFVSGNKWWKLKYNLEKAKTLGHSTVLTFGGAFSNHIYATAAATKELGLKSIGVIRGEEVLPLNETLAVARHNEMNLYFISREDYKRKTGQDFEDQLKEKFGDFYLIPEGGTNKLAVEGCAQLAKEKLSSLDFDYVCLPVGTGGTMAGIIAGLNGKGKVLGFSVLRGGGFLTDEIKSLVTQFSGKEFSNWHLESDYHFGGYAKRTSELDEFISLMAREHNLPLEFVYSGKMVAGVFDLIHKNYFESGSKILCYTQEGCEPKFPQTQKSFLP